MPIVETKESIEFKRSKFKFPYYIGRKKVRNLVVKLCEINPELKDAIENNVRYKLAIHVEDLQKLYPMNRSTKYRYKAVTEYLMEVLNVEMIILTSDNKLTDNTTLIKVNDDK